MSIYKSVLQRHASAVRRKGGAGCQISSAPLTTNGAEIPRENSLEERFYGTSLKISFAIKLVLLIQAIINTEKVFTDFFGISAISLTKNQHIYLICTTNSSNIKDLGKSNLTRCISMGNKVPIF